MRCDQVTVNGDRCSREATYTATVRYQRSGTNDAERRCEHVSEAFCTQHARYYGLHRRGGQRIADGSVHGIGQP